MAISDHASAHDTTRPAAAGVAQSAPAKVGGAVGGGQYGDKNAAQSAEPKPDSDPLAKLWSGVDCQFLANDFLGDYARASEAAFAASASGQKVGSRQTSGGGEVPAGRSGFLLWDPSQGKSGPPVVEGGPEQFHSLGWEHGRLPLGLAEFLAYKSSIAYTDWPTRAKADANDVWPQGTLQRHLADCCPGASHPGVFNVASPLGDTQGYGFLYQGVAYIVMRGTLGLTDWVTDLNDTLTTQLDYSVGGAPKFVSEPSDKIERPVAVLDAGGSGASAGTRYGLFGKLGRVAMRITLAPRDNTVLDEVTRMPRHLGFAMGWGIVRQQVEDWVKTLPRNGAQPFVFSGHSLGGALAFVGAHEFATRGRNIAAVVTFGAPMAGNKAFRTDYDETLKLKDRTFRLASNEDLVPVLSRASGYEHVGQLWEVAHRPRRSWWGMARVSFGLWLYNQFKFWKREKAKGSGNEKSNATGANKSKVVGTQDQPKKVELPWWKRPWRELLFMALMFLVALLVRQVLVSLAAHDMQKRYGLYLSTLVYNRFRSLRLQEATSDAAAEKDALEKAYQDVQRHLKLIRGGDDTLYKATRSGPVQVTSLHDLKSFLGKFANSDKGSYFS